MGSNKQFLKLKQNIMNETNYNSTASIAPADPLMETIQKTADDFMETYKSLNIFAQIELVAYIKECVVNHRNGLILDSNRDLNEMNDKHKELQSGLEKLKSI